jgi:hypothetical protein
LPAIYRTRDAELAIDAKQGGPLRQFIEVLAEQAMVVEENIFQLYDDQFIETCAEWVVPYIGDLVGARLIEMPDEADDLQFSRRAQVANTIATRRRKGTIAILEQIARDVTGFPARAVEFFKLVATTQHMNHVRLDHIVTPSMRDGLALEDVASPFTAIPRTPEVRRIQSGRGKFNLPNIGIFLWRLRSHPLTNVPAFPVDDRRFLFNPMGIDTQLYNVPLPEETLTTLAEPIHTPHPISRLRLMTQPADYYERAFTIFVDGLALDPGSVQVCNLADTTDGDWAHSPQDNIGVDPVLGRIHFPANTPPPPGPVTVTFHLPYVMPVGGGEYSRDLVTPDAADIVRVNTVEELEDGIDTMRASTSPMGDNQQGGIVEITDSGTYEWGPAVETNILADRHLVIRASDGARPLLNLQTQWDISGEANTRLTIDGLSIMKQPGTPAFDYQVRIRGEIEEVTIRHCTLVPGIELAMDGAPQQPGTPTIVIQTSTPCRVFIEHSIIGGMRMIDTASLTMQHSILDATADDELAFAAHDATAANRRPGGPIRLEACTVRGALYTHEMAAVSNCILQAEAPGGIPSVLAERQQSGCIRFSHHPTDVRLPRRYRCVPEDLEDETPDHPVFVSLRYGKPGYFQLQPNTPLSIRHGAEDGEEMGVYHNVYQRLRERNLLYQMNEYLRFGLQAGVFYVT